jgi:hypothetical protein
MASRRKTYAQRTRADTRAAAILAAAVSRPVVIEEDVNGFVAREWRAEELQTYKQADIVAALSGQRFFDEEELLQTIPPSAIRYSVSKGWLLKGAIAGTYWVTEKGATELRLPRKVAGVTLKFAKAA